MSNAKTAYGRVTAPRQLEAILEGRRNEFIPALLAILALLIIVSIFHVWSRVTVVDLNLKLSEGRKRFKDMQQEQARLKIEIASLKTPSRIEAVAHQQLGLTLPTNQQVVQVR